jgi:dihydroflavonol-4-reductase
MRVMITGITGFIGTHLAQTLLRSTNDELVGTYRDATKVTPFEQQGIEMRPLDLLDPQAFDGVTKDIDVVVHLAGRMRFHDPYDTLHAHNVTATQRIAQDALREHVRHFIYVSSTEAIGPVQKVPGDETSPYNPTYAYGRTKQEAEQWLKEQERTNGLPLTILRPTGVYGPGDVYVTLSTVRAVAQKKLRYLPGKGDAYIHFTYVDDVTHGFQQVIEQPDRSLGETFILASDEYVTYKEMFTIVASLLDVPPPSGSIPLILAKAYLSVVQWRNARKGVDDFVMHTSLVDTMKEQRAYSNEKAKKILGFAPRYTYRDGMKATIKWYKENNLL